MQVIRIGIDLAKNVFQVHGADQEGELPFTDGRGCLNNEGSVMKG